MGGDGTGVYGGKATSANRMDNELQSGILEAGSYAEVFVIVLVSVHEIRNHSVRCGRTRCSLESYGTEYISFFSFGFLLTSNHSTFQVSKNHYLRARMIMKFTDVVRWVGKLRFLCPRGKELMSLGQ